MSLQTSKVAGPCGAAHCSIWISCTGVCRCPCRLLKWLVHVGQLIVAYGLVVLECVGVPADFYKWLAHLRQLIVAYGLVVLECVGVPADFYKWLAHLWQLIVAYGIVCCTGVCRCPCGLLQVAGPSEAAHCSIWISCTGVCRCPCRLLQVTGPSVAAHCSIWYCVLYWSV